VLPSLLVALLFGCSAHCQADAMRRRILSPRLAAIEKQLNELAARPGTGPVRSQDG
jgi:hypothetical protein